jgi:hypothetical protein
MCTQVGTHLPVHLMQQNTSAVARCTPSIKCYPQYAVPAAAIVSIYVPDVRTKTVGLCSGAGIFRLCFPAERAACCSSPPHPCFTLLSVLMLRWYLLVQVSCRLHCARPCEQPLPADRRPLPQRCGTAVRRACMHQQNPAVRLPCLKAVVRPCCRQEPAGGLPVLAGHLQLRGALQRHQGRCAAHRRPRAGGSSSPE